MYYNAYVLYIVRNLYLPIARMQDTQNIVFGPFQMNLRV